MTADFAPASFAASRSQPAHRTSASPWEQAEHAREELEAMPAGSRTKADYTRTMDAFRELYHGDPGDMHAAASVSEVAELLAEQGRDMHDFSSLKSAIGQYEFLRSQYPGSSLRVAALLAEAQIEANDLHDFTAARECYSLLLKQYPHSEQVEEARAGLDALSADPSRAPLRQTVTLVRKPATEIAQHPANYAAPSISPPPETGWKEERNEGSGQTSKTELLQAGTVLNAHDARTPAGRGRSLARVQGIRHWSTPNYTRVAIDLGDDVKFEAARVPNPDRIYFDLHETRLAPELIGKSFAVTDDGFLKKIRAAQFAYDMTRIVLDVNDVSEYSAFLLPNPYRLIIDIHGRSRTTAPETSGGDSTVSQRAPVQAASTATGSSSLPSTPLTSSKPALPVPNTIATRSASAAEVAALSDQPGRIEATSRPTSLPIAAVVSSKDVRKIGQPAEPLPAHDPHLVKGPKAKARTSDGIAGGDALPARAAQPTSDGETSLVRALGLKIGRIVIDAGHGGHDSGTLGVDGLEEKDVVLDVALRLGKLLHERLGAEIIYTRSDDTFIPLETRTAIANRAQADLFLSIHANSSSDEMARGVETYYLNFTSSPDALETAARENAVSSQSIHQLSDLVRKITLRDKIDESREFASDVEQSLYFGLQRGNDGLKNRGVKKAPFVVLIGANMPSILAEISFVTNARDAAQLRLPDYRERVAESLYRGVARYEAGLSGAKASTLRASTEPR